MSHPEVRPATDCAVHRWGEAWKASPVPGEIPTRPLAGHHWELDGVSAAAWAHERRKPVVTIFTDRVQLPRLKFIGQVVNGNDRVSASDGVKAGQTLHPET